MIEGKERLKEEVIWKEKGRRERRNRNETKRNKQGCDSVFLACASFRWCVRTPLRPSSAGTSRTSTSRTGTSRIKCGHKHAISNSPDIPFPQSRAFAGHGQVPPRKTKPKCQTGSMYGAAAALRQPLSVDF